MSTAFALNETNVSSSGAASAAVWEPTLTAYSAALDEHRCVLQAVEMDVVMPEAMPIPPCFVAPADPPPIPDEYVPWARTLLETTDGLLQLAKDLATRSELRRGDRPVHPPLHSGQVVESTLNALL